MTMAGSCHDDVRMCCPPPLHGPVPLLDKFMTGDRCECAAAEDRQPVTRRLPQRPRKVFRGSADGTV